MTSFRYGSGGGGSASRARPTQDFYRDKMMELADARGSALTAEKKKREKMISDMEREESGKWGDLAMMGASLGGMIGGAVAPGVGALPGMGIGAAIGAGLGGVKALAADKKPGLKELARGAVPSPMMAAFGGQSMAQQIASDDMRRGRFGPRPQMPGGGVQGAQGMMQAMMPMAQMGAAAAGGMQQQSPNAMGGFSPTPMDPNMAMGGPGGAMMNAGGGLSGGMPPAPTPPPGMQPTYQQASTAMTQLPMQPLAALQNPPPQSMMAPPPRPPMMGGHPFAGPYAAWQQRQGMPYGGGGF